MTTTDVERTEARLESHYARMATAFREAADEMERCGQRDLEKMTPAPHADRAANAAHVLTSLTNRLKLLEVIHLAAELDVMIAATPATPNRAFAAEHLARCPASIWEDGECTCFDVMIAP